MKASADLTSTIVRTAVCSAFGLLLLSATSHAQVPENSASAQTSPTAADPSGALVPSPPRVPQMDQLSDRIVAVVGEDIVTERELVQRMTLVANQQRLEGQLVPDQSSLARGVLRDLIDLRAQLQEASRVGIDIDDGTLNRTLEGIARENGLDLFQFRDALVAEGIDFNEFRRQIREELTITRLRTRQVDERIRVSDREIDDLIAAESSTIDQRTRYQLDELFVPVATDASSAALRSARDQAERLHDQLRRGASFEDLATDRSLGEDWILARDLPSSIARSVVLLAPDTPSEILRTRDGFHIVKIRQREGASASVEQIRARHILISPNELVSTSEAQRRAQEILQRLRQGDDFAQLAGANSDDPGSASRGGELGWLSPGDTVDAFEQAMGQMSPNDPPRLVRSEFGFHIIDVLQRRTIDNTRERLREQATEILRERKREEEAQTWLEQLRGQTFIDIRIPALAS